MTNKFSLFVGLLAIVAVGGLLVNRSNVPKTALTSPGAHEHVIELRKDGFYPEEMIIVKGRTVTFVTKKDVPFWPASNIHPTHAIYSEFDPNREIAPDESWNFTFNKVGEWRYHDHSAPYYTGTIVVVEELAGHHHATYENLNCEDLNNLPAGDKEKCWDKILGDAVKKEGIEEAMEKFKDLYTSDQDFASFGCHWYAHRIGEEAYGEKNDDWIKNFPQEVSYCSYGFVHGFLEHHFRKERDVPMAKELCDYLDKNLGDNLPRIRLNCFHTIGHGFVDDPPPLKAWGSPHAVVDNALKVCEKVSPVEEEVKECFDGAFNTLVNFMFTNQYKFALDEKDPLGFCGDLPEKHQYSCYYEFAQTLNMTGNRSFTEIANLTKNIKDKDISAMVVNTAAASLVPKNITNSPVGYIADCRTLDKELSLQCIRGVVGGLMAHGEPGKEYVKALNFCQLPELTTEEREACYETAFHAIKNLYPLEKVEPICSSINEQYQQYCL